MIIKIKNCEKTLLSKLIKEEKIVPKKIIAFGLNPATIKPSLKNEKVDFVLCDFKFTELILAVYIAATQNF